MKAYSISKPVFWTIFALILTLPVSREWRLISTGQKTRVTVGIYEHYGGYDRLGNHHIYEANRIVFMAGKTRMFIHGPDDFDLGVGRELTLWYDRENPRDYCLFNFMALYNTWSGVLTLMLILFWSAFYMSYGYYIRGVRGKGKGNSGKEKGDSGGGRRKDKGVRGKEKGDSAAREALPRQRRNMGSPGSFFRR